MKNILPTSFKNIKCEILGLGISNVALAEFLISEGARLILRDASEPSDEIKKRLIPLAEKCYFGENYLTEISGEYIFRSPSIRPDIPQLASALNNGAVLSGEWELFFDRCPANTVAVTGSDGKTTTVTLIERILNTAFSDRRYYSDKAAPKAFFGGNIGIPLISLLSKITEEDTVVAELSSFQLMTLCRGAHKAAITNITPNHLDYHRDMREYSDAKFKIVTPDCHLFIPPFTDGEPTNLTPVFNNYSHKIDIYCEKEIIYLNNTPLLNTDELLLRGSHNIRNFMTAIALTCDIAKPEHYRAVAQSFGGVSHRMEKILEANGISFFDSSIDSTPSRTRTTLACFSKPLTVICGGYDKNLDYRILAEALEKYATAVILTGSSANKIAAAINELPLRSFELYIRENFDDAVRLSAEITPMGGNVLLSPACASFDQFNNYIQRSRRFAEILSQL